MTKKNSGLEELAEQVKDSLRELAFDEYREVFLSMLVDWLPYRRCL